jgi:hypothetical protein
MYKTIQTKTGRAFFIILFFIVFITGSFPQVATKYTFSQADETFTSITGEQFYGVVLSMMRYQKLLQFLPFFMMEANILLFLYLQMDL